MTASTKWPSSSTSTERASSHILYFDLLAIVSCFGVIALHCNGLVHSYSISPDRWPQALVVEVLFYWPVNVFFMLTGAKNLTYRAKRSTSSFLQRRLKKLLLPWFLWSVFAYIIRYVLGDWSDSPSMLDFVSRFLSPDGVVSIYWFFPCIISLTLTMPVLSCLINHRKALWYLVGCAFVFISIIDPVTKMIGVSSITGGINFPLATYPIMLACLGYLVTTQEVPKSIRIVIYIAAIASMVFRYATTYILSVEAGSTVRLTWGYGSFVGVLPAVAVFLIFKHHDWETGFFGHHQKAITQLSGATFGIYLIHIFVLRDFIMGVFGIGYASLALRTVGPFVVFFASLAIVLILKRIPLAKNIVP